MSHSFAIALIRSEKIRTFYQYWAEKRSGKAMPCRADLDASEIKPVLSSIMVTEITRDPFRVFYRLVGTEVARRSGQDFTGSFLDDLGFEADEGWTECYRLTALRRRPLFGQFTMRRRDNLFLTGEYGLFPLSDDGAIVSQCFAVVDFESLARRAA